MNEESININLESINKPKDNDNDCKVNQVQSDSIFSASEPKLGYEYQDRYGLMLIVIEQNPNAKLLIEKIDDISIETPSKLNLYQTKLHINSIANLTNASPDLWKTIRVWSEGIKEGRYDPDNCLFHLVTTATAPPETISFLLKHDTTKPRNIETIQKLLKNVIIESKSKTNKEAYKAFSSLTDDQQKRLIKNISLVDTSVDINKAKDIIKQRLSYSVIPERIEALFERLEGWFVGEVILQLQNQRAEITGKNVLDKILDIADSLRIDNLPSDFTKSIASSEEQLAPYRYQIFVKQLEAIGINFRLINHAISDYHRAFSQKSKWLREGLIQPIDEIEYDEKLFDDWDKKFATLSDYIDESEEIRKKEGKNFYESYYVKSSPNINIKERFKEQYMITGSCQILSDKKKIGWHPNFKKLI